MTNNLKYNAFIALVAVGVGSLAVYAKVAQNTVERAEALLKKNGYQQVVVGDKSVFCAPRTGVARNFEATNTAGQRVRGEICADRFLMPDNITTKPVSKPKM